MNSQQDKYGEMETKLREGLKILSEASQEDIPSLNAAIIKIHGAFEDFVRLELAAKAPQLMMVVENKRTTWKDLIEYGKRYLDFTDNDASIITEANIQRQRVAHGGNYSGSLSELVSYAAFVQKWCTQGNLSVRDIRPQRAIEAPISYRPSPPPPPETYANDPVKPWYRSTLVLFLTFFILPPVWALLILTDRSQRGFARLIASLNLLILFFCVIGFILYSGVFANNPIAQVDTSRTPASSSVAALTPIVITEASLQPVSTGVPCDVVWSEYSSDDLAGKNRSMVWRQIVGTRVNGSGMTPNEFYDLVVEHNPDLITDGYEFKSGKTYELPQCQ